MLYMIHIGVASRIQLKCGGSPEAMLAVLSFICSSHCIGALYLALVLCYNFFFTLESTAFMK